MRIYEYESKQLFRKAGIAVPRSIVVTNPAETVQAAEHLGCSVIIKPQTLIKARGKAGLIFFADSGVEAERAVENLYGRVHEGESIDTLLVEEKVIFDQELYLGITVDYASGRPVFIASARGGVDIEETAKEYPDTIIKVAVDPVSGITEIQANEIIEFVRSSYAGMGSTLQTGLREIVMTIYSIFTRYDCEMLEVNPLVVSNGEFVALDAALAIDGDALFRQADLVRPRGQNKQEFELEQDYSKRGWTFLKLDGDIGILSSGAGITMAIMDLMRASGGRPANFLDTAQMNRKGIYDALHIFKDDPNIKTLLINIFAGLNRCDELALGITDFYREYKLPFPVVVRMAGNREEQGLEIMKKINIQTIAGLEEAVWQAIKVTEDRP